MLQVLHSTETNALNLVFDMSILMVCFCCQRVQCIHVEPTAWFFIAHHSRATEIAWGTRWEVCCH